jgi:hypothetical protein
MENKLIKECLDILTRDEVKDKIRVVLTPIIDLIMKQLYPYIYICVSLVCLMFLLVLAILILLITILRNKNWAEYWVNVGN